MLRASPQICTHHTSNAPSSTRSFVVLTSQHRAELQPPPPHQWHSRPFPRALRIPPPTRVTSEDAHRCVGGIFGIFHPLVTRNLFHTHTVCSVCLSHTHTHTHTHTRTQTQTHTHTHTHTLAADLVREAARVSDGRLPHELELGGRTPRLRETPRAVRGAAQRPRGLKTERRHG